MPYFVPGEEELAAMTAQLKKMRLKEDNEKYTRLMELCVWQNVMIWKFSFLRQ